MTTCPHVKLQALFILYLDREMHVEKNPEKEADRPEKALSLTRIQRWQQRARLQRYNLQKISIRPFPGFENAAGKLRQKW